jgi:predicted DNA-binding transcriptional regulator AlpA
MQPAIGGFEMTTRNPLHDEILYKDGVCQLLGGGNDMKIFRLLNDPRAQFPRPSYLGRRPWWWRGEVIQWLETKAPLTRPATPQGRPATPAEKARRAASRPK